MIDGELSEIAAFIKTDSPIDSLVEMEQDLDRAIQYGFRIGELFIGAQHEYHKKKSSLANSLRAQEDLTETMRKAYLDAGLADEAKVLAELKNLATHLRGKRMFLHQSIKTRRNEK